MTAPLYELSIERFIDAPPETVWTIITERMAEFWCPRPWTTDIVEMDWRAGGRCAMIMHGPAGEESPIEGIVLEVVPGRRFVFTDAFSVGWIPKPPFMTGVFEISPEGNGTRYRASARHWNEETMQQHAAMGFTDGWAKVADQLAELAEA